MKLAAIEAEWETQEAPAAFTLFGLPNEETQHTDYAVKIPAVLGLIATRSLDEQVPGLREIKENNLKRIVRGQQAYDLMQRIRAGDKSATTLEAFNVVAVRLRLLA